MTPADSAASEHHASCDVHNPNPPWACTCGLDLLQARQQAQRYRQALQEIAEMDYRGNRSPESEIAFRALTTVKP